MHHLANYTDSDSDLDENSQMTQIRAAEHGHEPDPHEAEWLAKTAESKKTSDTESASSRSTDVKNDNIKVDFFSLGDSDLDSDGSTYEPSPKLQKHSLFLLNAKIGKKHAESSVSAKSGLDTKQSVIPETPNSVFWESGISNSIEQNVTPSIGCSKHLMVGSLHEVHKDNNEYKTIGGDTVKTNTDKQCYQDNPHYMKSSLVFKKNSQPSPMGSGCLKKSPFYVHHKIAKFLHSTGRNFIPKSRNTTFDANSKCISRIKWCSDQYSHLLLSVGMDTVIKIWNVFSQVSSHVKVLSGHKKAIKDAIWDKTGRGILSCGYDDTARLTDVEKETTIAVYEHSDCVTSVQYHPENEHIFIAGSKNCLMSWDIRTSSKPIRRFSYNKPFGQVQDVAFTWEGKEVFTCNDAVCRDSADKNIMAWDFNMGVVVSNQIYQERYTCCCLQMHPHKREFVAQSQGNYIAIFSTERPYKLNKCKRFEAHKVAGYAVQCDISADGSYIASGSTEGVVIYDYDRAKVMKRLGTDPNDVCVDVAWHPVLNSTLAASTWGGNMHIWN